MSLGDFLKKQLLDIIQWTESDDGVLSFRFPMRDMEIQYGAQLTVRESQVAVFVNEGVVADVFGPGRYKLETQTLPVLTALKSWMYGFEGPFKADVYFFSARQQLNQRWGTQQPITVRDKEFGAIRLRGFGTYSYHLADAKLFHQQISGTREIYRTSDLTDQLSALVIANTAQALADSQIPFIDLAANTLTLGNRLRDTLRPHFAALGLTLDTFVVESLSLPEELQKRLDTRAGVAMAGDLDRYAKLQAADALPLAAQNEGGVAGAGVGMAAGLAMGQIMAQQLGATARPTEPTASPATAPIDGATKFCLACGAKMPERAKFCPKCGEGQA